MYIVPVAGDLVGFPLRRWWEAFFYLVCISWSKRGRLQKTECPPRQQFLRRSIIKIQSLPKANSQPIGERCLADSRAVSVHGPDGFMASEGYLRRRRFRLRIDPAESNRARRLAFAATRRRYIRIISSGDAPAIMLVLALSAASIFSVTINFASRRAVLPPSINFISLSPTTRFASTPNIIHDRNIDRPQSCANRAGGPVLDLRRQRATTSVDALHD